MFSQRVEVGWLGPEQICSLQVWLGWGCWMTVTLSKRGKLGLRVCGSLAALEKR